MALQQSRKLICKSREKYCHVIDDSDPELVVECVIIRTHKEGPVGAHSSSYMVMVVVVVIIVIVIMIIFLMKYCFFDSMVLHGSSYFQRRMMEQSVGKLSSPVQ